jgi:GTPase
LVFNKLDLVEDPLLPKILKAAYRNSIFVSAHAEDDMVRLRRHVFKYFEENLVQATLEVSSEDQMTLSIIYKACLIIGSDYTDQDKVVFTVRATPAVLAKLHPNVVSMQEKIGFTS